MKPSNEDNFLSLWDEWSLIVCGLWAARGQGNKPIKKTSHPTSQLIIFILITVLILLASNNSSSSFWVGPRRRAECWLACGAAERKKKNYFSFWVEQAKNWWNQFNYGGAAGSPNLLSIPSLFLICLHSHFSKTKERFHSIIINWFHFFQSIYLFYSICLISFLF